jgi:HEAT repeat protein
MKRVVTSAVLFVLVSTAAWAQTPPPPPPPPQTTPPPTTPPPVQPAPLPPLPPDVVVATPVVPATPPPTVVYRDQFFERRALAPVAMPTPFPPSIDAPFAWASVDQNGVFLSTSRSSDPYSVAISQLERRQYEQAIATFDRVIAQKGQKSDAAFHWKAFSQFRLGRWDDSLATIAQLRRDFPQSRYLAEAKMLEADVRRFSGQTLNPAQIDDDDLKLIALSGLQRTDPARALPLVEQVLNANNSLRVKKNALFILAQSDQPRAQEVLLSFAKGQGNPDLQATAISYVASRRAGPTTGRELAQIYDATSDLAVRMTIINAFRTAGNKESLLSVVGDHAAPHPLRERAVTSLNGLISPQELMALYQKESNRDLRIQMVNVFSSMRAVDQLMQIVKTEKEPAVRQRAIRALGGLAPEQSGRLLAELYDANTDVETRRSIISALGSQQNAEGLIAIARKETSLNLKGEIVRRIADLAPKNKAAADYLAEIIRN